MNAGDRVREVTLLIVSPLGDPVGTLPPFPVAVPYLQEVECVVGEARSRFGVDVAILRLLATRDEGEVVHATYAAQPMPHAGTVPERLLTPFRGSLPDAAKRLPYAKPGGPAADLAWAEAALEHAGHVMTGATQRRTWNLSSVWRITAGEEVFWLKCVPPFFASEGALIAYLEGERVPALVAAEGHRILMPDLPGRDRYGAGLPEIRHMVALLVDLQWRRRNEADALLALGVADARASALADTLAALYRRHRDSLGVGERRAMDGFIANLPARLDAIAGCGIPETLVHGDYHPGNLRGEDGDLTILDWGDAMVGSALLDLPGVLDRADPSFRDPLLQHWHALWAERVPGADVVAACRLILPVAALRMAAQYQMFLDNIEPAEHVYHARDPADYVGRTIALLAT